MSVSPSVYRRRAYSYIRFSHPGQALGGSLARQAGLAKDYCNRHNLELDEELTLHDLGVSAFKGDNVKEGALAGFLEACRMGRVKPGSVLIVESLDRLSRDEIRPALQLFFALQEHGITIVTLAPERQYPPEGKDALALIEPLIVFARAHEESLMKSHRRRDGWRQKKEKARADGGRVCRACPAWLLPDEEGTGFLVKEEARATVLRIYSLAAEGMGVKAICEVLNREKVPPLMQPRKKRNGTMTRPRWISAYVHRILALPAAAGGYQPMRMDGKREVKEGEIIWGYYPSLVERKAWADIRAGLRGRRFGGRMAGRKSKDDANLFSGLIRCARSGEAMHLATGLGRKAPGGRARKRYLYLVASREAGAQKADRVAYDVLELAVFCALKEVTAADIAGEPKKNGSREAALSRLSGRLFDLNQRLERAKERYRTAPADRQDALLDLVGDLAAEKKEVQAELAAVEENEPGRPAADLGAARSLIDLLGSAEKEEAPELRRRLRMRIRELFSEMRALVVRRGRDRLYGVQMFFRDPSRRRFYLILNEHGGRAFSRAGLPLHGDRAAFDLREPYRAEELAEELAKLDLDRVRQEQYRIR